MLRKFAYVLILLLLFSPKLYADSWDDFTNLDRMWDGQKSVTNQEFEKVMEKLEEKSVQKEEKQKKKKLKKLFGGGDTLHKELNPEKELKEQEIIIENDAVTLINLPVNLLIDGKILEKGFYNIVPIIDKENGKKYLEFYQSQFLKARFEVHETQDDYGEEELNFARILPYNEGFVKLIFGSIDFNAYAYLPFVD